MKFVATTGGKTPAAAHHHTRARRGAAKRRQPPQATTTDHNKTTAHTKATHTTPTQHPPNQTDCLSHSPHRGSPRRHHGEVADMSPLFFLGVLNKFFNTRAIERLMCFNICLSPCRFRHRGSGPTTFPHTAACATACGPNSSASRDA